MVKTDTTSTSQKNTGTTHLLKLSRSYHTFLGSDADDAISGLYSQISLDFNSAESGDSDAGLQDIELSDETTTPYVPPRFTLAFSKGSPRATSVFERRSQASVEKDDDDVDDPQARAVYWIPTNCDSLSEVGSIGASALFLISARLAWIFSKGSKGLHRSLKDGTRQDSAETEDKDINDLELGLSTLSLSLSTTCNYLSEVWLRSAS